MGISSGKSKNKGGNQNNLSQSVWAPQGNALGGMYGQAGQVGDWSTGAMQGLAPGMSEKIGGVADQMNPAFGQQLQGGAYAGMDLQGMYQNALGGGGNEQFINEQIMGGAGNDFVDAMRGQMESDAYTNMMGGLRGLDARAAASGMSGGSRHGIAQGQTIQGAQDALANQQTQLGYNTFDKDLDRKMSIARNADAFDQAKLQNISGMLGQQQNAMQGGLNFGQNMQGAYMGGMSPYMAPWQAMNQYSGVLGNPTVLSNGMFTGNASGNSKSGGFGK